ncbi:MAG: DUF2971 domain-containing protein [Nitrospira sp.]|nr:DUF2971 domain-containing protein [Nitrospira sp.]
MILGPMYQRYVEESESLQPCVQDARRLGIDLFDHDLKRFVRGFEEAQGRATDHYVVSFCKASDAWVSQHGLLSQWRGYGLDGGYAIVFDRERLGLILEQESKMYHEEGLFLGDVQYHLAENINVEDEQVRGDIERISRCFYKYLTTEDIQVVYPAFESITRLSIYCKHRGFEEEQEVRIVITEPSIEVGLDPKKPDDKPYRRTQSYLRNGAAVPCIHLLEDQELRTLPIRRIIVGPHPDKLERKRAVEILLHEQGIDAKVFVSETPFRGK